MQTTRESVLYLDTIRSKGRWPEKCRQRERSFPPVTLIRSGTKHTQDKVGREFFKAPSTVHSSNAPGTSDFGTRSIIGKHFWDFCEPSSRVRSPDHHPGMEWRSHGKFVCTSRALCLYIFIYHSSTLYGRNVLARDLQEETFTHNKRTQRSSHRPRIAIPLPNTHPRVPPILFIILFYALRRYFPAKREIATGLWWMMAAPETTADED